MQKKNLTLGQKILVTKAVAQLEVLLEDWLDNMQYLLKGPLEDKKQDMAVEATSTRESLEVREMVRRALIPSFKALDPYCLK